MRKLILAAVLSAFAFTSFHASACDRDADQSKGTENTQAKKDSKKSHEAAKSNPKKS